jgi:membrane protein DedA with SNARE-associated domain
MPWPTFLLWNALGGIAWATSVGLLAYFVGAAAERLFKLTGLFGIGVAVLALVAFVLWRRWHRPPDPSGIP